MPRRTNKDCRRRWWNCLANSHIRGSWAEEEDERLIAAVQKYGTNWSQVANEVGSRNSDQCSSHWNQVLNPNINYCDWTEDEVSAPHIPYLLPRSSPPRDDAISLIMTRMRIYYMKYSLTAPTGQLLQGSTSPNERRWRSKIDTQLCDSRMRTKRKRDTARARPTKRANQRASIPMRFRRCNGKRAT